MQIAALLEYLDHLYAHFVRQSNIAIVSEKIHVKLPIPGFISGNNFENNR